MNAVITGASAGIGEALTLLLAERGGAFVLVARRAERIAALATRVRERGGIAHELVADLEQEREVVRVGIEAQRLLGSIDVVVHNAGRGNCASVEDTSIEGWRRMFALNVEAPFLLTKALLPQMRERNAGHHVYVSSMAGKIGYPYNAAYVAAKHALVGFVAALRTELIETDVMATIVCPSGVASEWGSVTEGGSINDLYAVAIPRSRELAQEHSLSLAPLKPMISPESAAQCIVEAIDIGRSNDIYTHEGTMELAVQADTQRIQLEEDHRALWMAMSEVYRSQH